MIANRWGQTVRARQRSRGGAGTHSLLVRDDTETTNPAEGCVAAHQPESPGAGGAPRSNYRFRPSANPLGSTPFRSGSLPTLPGGAAITARYTPQQCVQLLWRVDARRKGPTPGDDRHLQTRSPVPREESMCRTSLAISPLLGQIHPEGRVSEHFEPGAFAAALTFPGPKTTDHRAGPGISPGRRTS